jgi:hypothetical protein
MIKFKYDSEELQAYRKKATDLSKLRAAIGDSIGAGSLEQAQQSLQELALRTEEFRNLREGLTPIDRVMSDLRVIDDYTVAFSIPKGCSRMDILVGAQRIVGDHRLIAPPQLEDWAQQSEFNEQVCNDEKVCIRGRVWEATGKTRDEQERIFKEKRFEWASVHDTAVAFAAFYIATGQSLFGWAGREATWTDPVRVKPGQLEFCKGGLVTGSWSDSYTYGGITAAARIYDFKDLRI